MLMRHPVTSAYESHPTVNDWHYVKNVVNPEVLNSKKFLFTVVPEHDYYADTIKFRLDVVKKGKGKGPVKRYVVETLEDLVQTMNAIALLEH